MSRKLFASQKISPSFNYYGMKIILSDAESREEHQETKYSPIRQMTAELRSFLCLDVGKITDKGMKIEMNKAFWMIVKKATFLAHFIDWDHQN